MEQYVENLRKSIDRHPLPVDFGASNNYNSLAVKQEWREKDMMLFETSVQNSRNTCVYCDRSNHRSIDCCKVLGIANRKEKLRIKDLCFNCTKAGHMASRYNSRGCNKCGGRHYTTLCDKMMSMSAPGMTTLERGQEGQLPPLSSSMGGRRGKNCHSY